MAHTVESVRNGACIVILAPVAQHTRWHPFRLHDVIGVQLPFDTIPWRLIALKCGSVCVQNEPDNVQVLT